VETIRFRSEVLLVSEEWRFGERGNWGVEIGDWRFLNLLAI
jgi:hypothetical protein